MQRIRSTIALIALAFTFGPGAMAQAQTYTWNGGAGNGNWNASTNWTGGLPVSAADTIIRLNGSTQTLTTQNIANPFDLNQLVMLNEASSGFTVGGDLLRFRGTGATIRTESTGGPLRITAPIIFDVNTNLDPTANNPTGAELFLNGALEAGSGITVSTGSSSSVPSGMIVLGSSSQGFRGTWSVTNSTTTQVNAINAFAREARVSTTGNFSSFAVGVTSASGLTDAGTGIQLSSIEGTGQFSVGTSSSPSAAAVGFGNADFAITGSGSLSSGNADSHFAKVGTGVFSHSGGQATFRGSFSVRDGAFNLSGSSSSNGGFGTASTGPITVYTGAQLGLAMTGTGTNGRIGTNQPVILQGGTFRFDASGLGDSASGFSEVLGGLTVGAGQSTLQVDTSTVRGARLNFASLAAGSPTGTLFVRSGNLGTASLNTLGSGNVNFATNPNNLFSGTTEGYTAGTTNLRILPFGFAATTATGSPQTLVAFDSTNSSLRGLDNADYASAFGNADLNVSLGTSVAVDSAATANALRLTSGGSVAVSSGLTITSGALLNADGGSITGTGSLTFGSSTTPSTAFITTNGAMGISAAISASNFSKNGEGNLSLTGVTTLSTESGNGAVAVNAGTLSLGTGGSFTNATSYQVSRGATFSVAGTSTSTLALGSNQTLTGAGTVVGSVTAGANSTIAPSMLGGPDANRASPGTLTVNGNVALNGGSTLNWLVNSAVTNGDNSVSPTVGTLDNFKSQYTASLLQVVGDLDLSGASSTNPITLKLNSLGLSNAAGNVYDLNQNTDTRSWVIAEATGQIVGFAPNKFVFDTTGFTSAGTTGIFSLSQIGSSLVLNVAPVPEPATVLGISALALGVGNAIRRRRRLKACATGQSCE